MLSSRAGARGPLQIPHLLRHVRLAVERTRGAEWKTPDRLQPAIKAPEAAPRRARVVLTVLADITSRNCTRSPLRFFWNRRERPDPHSLRTVVQPMYRQILVRDPTPGLARAAGASPPRRAPPWGFAEDEGMLGTRAARSPPTACCTSTSHFRTSFSFDGASRDRNGLAGGFKDRAS